MALPPFTPRPTPFVLRILMFAAHVPPLAYVR